MKLKEKIFILTMIGIISISGGVLTYNILTLINPTLVLEEVKVKKIVEKQTAKDILPSAGVGAVLDGNDDALDAVAAMIEETKIVEVEEELDPPSPLAPVIDNLTEEEIELICRVTYKEAGDQGEIGQRAVMEVILNRLNHEAFPDVIYDVLSAPSQFSVWEKIHEVSDEHVEDMKEILYIVRNTEESIFVKYIEEAGLDCNPEDYVYFGREVQDYHKNSIQIKDHWFGTR